MDAVGKRLLARAEAFQSCADHLELGWTDDNLERAEGDKLKAKFYSEARRLRELAQAHD